MENALIKLTSGPAAHLDHLCAQLHRCAVCGAALEGDEDEAATAAFAARWKAAYRKPALLASAYAPGMRVFLWDSGCLAIVVDSSHLHDGMIQVDDLHVDPIMGHPFTGLVYPASQLRPATEAA